MDTAQAVGMFVVGGGALLAIITPIIKLNSSIVSLTVKIDNLVNDLTRNEKRITEHGKGFNSHNCSWHFFRIRKSPNTP